jgi:autotransporter-associated beta strand protein
MYINMRAILTMAGAIVLACCQARAAAQYFDVDPGTAPIDGGAGNWIDSLWKAAPDGTTSNAWVDGSQAVFNPISGTPDSTVVTLSGTVGATGGVSFNGAGYTLTGGTLNIGSSWFNMAQAATISSVLTRLQVTNNAELVISGGGALAGRAIIGSAGSDSRVRQTGGDLTVVSEYMMIGGNNIANAKGEYILDGGTLTVQNGIYFGWNSATSYGTLTQNGGVIEIKSDLQGIQLGINGGHGTYNLNGGILLSTFGTGGTPYTYQTFVFAGGLFKARAATYAQSGMVTSISDSKTAFIDTQSYTLTFPCVISGASAAGLTKGGSGILVLSGANTYAGVSLISNGTLRVSNTSGSGTGISSVIITNGAALDGTGTISGSVTVAENGILSGGADGSGTLTLAQTPTLAQGVKFRFVANTDGTSCGRLHSNGDLDLSKMALEASTVSQPVIGGTYTIASCDGALIGSFSATNLPATYVVTVDPVGKTVQLTRGAMYVSNSGNDANDGSSWATAKATIQAGVDNVGVNGTVLVSNGLYTTGSYLTPGFTLNNRVVITNTIIVRSFEPQGAVIQGPGASAYNTGGALRCVYMNAGVLDGFVLEGGATAGGGVSWNTVGGGLAIDSTTAYATNCVIRNSKAYAGGGTYYGVLRGCIVTNNVAEQEGGGINQGVHSGCIIDNNSTTSASVGHGGGVRAATLSNCRISNNRAAASAGGAYGGTLSGCELISNVAVVSGGGMHSSTLTNCLVRNNTCAGGTGGGGAGVCLGTAYDCTIVSNTVTGGNGGGSYGTTLYRCKVLYNTQASAVGNAGGACKGTAYSTLFAYNTGVSVGGIWDEDAYGCTVVSNKATTSNGPGIHYATGRKIYNCLAFYNAGGTGVDIANLSASSAVSNTLAGSASTVLPGITIVPAGTPVFADSAQGDYHLCGGSPAINAGNTALNQALNTYDLDLNVRVSFGTVDAGAYEFNTQCVSHYGNDANNGYTWATAKQTIQGGLNASTPGGLVLVTNGTYATGSYATPGGGTTSNRVVLTNAVTVRSVNGPGVTAIQGGGTYNVAGATRCVFMNSGVLDGFTLENGVTKTGGTPGEYTRGGGGVCIMNAAPGTTVKNCVIRNNTAQTGGGVTGGQSGTYAAYTYKNNATVTDCIITNNTAGYGGGIAYYAIFNRCVVAGNTATQGSGGYGVENGVNNSLIVRNTAGTSGGAIYIGPLRNCTLADNTNGGTASTCSLYNCIVWANTGINVGSSTTLSSCFTNNPSFRDAPNGNYRLMSTSPCLNTGNNAEVSGTLDLEGRTRISFGTVDIGAFELQEYLNVTFNVAPGIYVATATNLLTVQIVSTNGVYGSSIPTNAVYWSGHAVADWNSGPDGTGTLVTSATPLLSLEDHTVYARWIRPATMILFQ